MHVITGGRRDAPEAYTPIIGRFDPVAWARAFIFDKGDVFFVKDDVMFLPGEMHGEILQRHMAGIVGLPHRRKAVAEALANDAVLVSAWEDFRSSALAALDVYDDGEPHREDDPLEQAIQRADRVIDRASARTIAGAIVKLRRAILMMCSNRDLERAMLTGDDEALFAMTADVDWEASMTIEALQTLISLAPINSLQESR